MFSICIKSKGWSTCPPSVCFFPQSLKAIVTPESLLVLDFRGLGLERWLVLDLASQLASQTHSLPFEFRALEAILQHKVRQIEKLSVSVYLEI